MVMLSDVEPVIVVGCEDLKAVLSHVLSIDLDRLGWSAVGEVSHIDSESIFIVICRVIVTDELLEQVAEILELCAEFSGDGCLKPVCAEKLIHTKRPDCVVNQIVVL